MRPLTARFAGMGPPRPLAWRRSRFGTNAERVARALLIASTLYVLLLMLIALLMPFQKQFREVVEIPERQVTVLMDEPEPVAPPAPLMQSPEQVAVRQVADPVVPEGLVREPDVLPTPPRPRERVAPDRGTEGRRRAEQATAQLASATAALDGALGSLSSSLRDAKDGSPDPSRRRRARGVRGGRDDAALSGLETGRPETGGADLDGSAIGGSIVAVGSIAPASADASGGFEAPESRSGSAPGVYRSNASLLAVIQRYAAGIQFCYENELNRQPGLRGKLVVAIAVAPSGEVTEATVVQNTLGSSRIASCALAQIRQWKFPPISGGVTSFQTPFVFTPPN